MWLSVILVLGFSALTFLASKEYKGIQISRKQYMALIAVLFSFAGILRIYLAVFTQGYGHDIDIFKAWGQTVNTVGYQQVYSQDMFLDYPPGYLYILGFLDRLRLFFNIDYSSNLYTSLIKLPSIIADLVCAALILSVCLKKNIGNIQSALISCLYLLCPAILINSSRWGQADSFCTTILVIAVLLLYNNKNMISAAVYGIAIICKPQMLVFAPVFLFLMIKRRKFMHLLGGVAVTLACLALTALPFTEGFNFIWLIEQYQSGMSQYPYYSVNCYNFWSLVGKNWSPLPDGFASVLLNWSVPFLITAGVGVMILKSKKEHIIFAACGFSMYTLYLFGVQMHERYLFPAIAFMLLSYVLTGNKRLLASFAMASALHYINVAYVLYIYQVYYTSYDPNTSVTVIISLLQLIPWFFYVHTIFAIYLRGEKKSENVPSASAPSIESDRKITMQDIIIACSITALFATICFSALGSATLAKTVWSAQQDDTVIFEVNGTYNEVRYIAGVAPQENATHSKVGTDILIEVSDDMQIWHHAAELGGSYVFMWQKLPLSNSGRYVRLTALNDNVALAEIAFCISESPIIMPVSALDNYGHSLIDEQETVPVYVSYYNSSYFDEIYHGRTGYEFVLGLDSYENTHPPLGKLIISLGIRLWGLSPFGFRFMGALFGTLMLPAFYFLLKMTVRKTLLCTAGTILLAFDFMHYAQSRIATIDTYAVFFIILMYCAMSVFMNMDLQRDKMSKLLTPLIFCGAFTGLGAASKWTALYAAAGLAVLFFSKFGVSLYKVRENKNELNILVAKSLTLCAYCTLIFIALPFAIYFMSFLPLTTMDHNEGNLWGSFVGYQNTMLSYHSTLDAQHPASSSWYEWPFNIKPTIFQYNEPVDSKGRLGTISTFGNPLLWWSFIPAVAYASVRLRGRGCTGLFICATAAASTFLPWVLVSRITFIYHYYTAVPFLIGILMLVSSDIMDRPFMKRSLSLSITGTSFSIRYGGITLSIFVCANILLFALFYPVISGVPTTREYANMLEWLPQWFFA